MKVLFRFILTGLLIANTGAVSADTTGDTNTTAPTDNYQLLTTYLQNLGSFLGYNITNAPSTSNPPPALWDYTTTALIQTLAISTFFGSIPTATVSNNPTETSDSSNTFQFITNGSNTNNILSASVINGTVNASFPQYALTSSYKSNLTVSTLMDQPIYQTDPVSQTLLNILGTPDTSACLNKDGTWPTSCAFTNNAMYSGQVLANIIGTIPPPNQYFSFSYNQPLLGQLNSDSLIAPLFLGISDSSSTDSDGFSGQNQAQQAQNFIRYASGTIIPIPAPDQNKYSSLYRQAYPKQALMSSTTSKTAAQYSAQNTLNQYFASLRVYAAQSSVGLGNMYYILSKKLPQPSVTGASSQTSAALNEYTMASWRLSPGVSTTDSSGKTTTSPNWVNGINSGTAATVQKEIAVLLAEINYQLYLDRQIQERMLLSQSVLLMQSSKYSLPKLDDLGLATDAPLASNSSSGQ